MNILCSSSNDLIFWRKFDRKIQISVDQSKVLTKNANKAWRLFECEKCILHLLFYCVQDDPIFYELYRHPCI